MRPTAPAWAALLFVATACEAPVTPVQPTPRPWSPPAFEGDGLPASEGEDHHTYDTGAEGGPAPTPPPQGGEDEPPALTVTDGLFAVVSGNEDAALTLGSLALTAKSLGCYDLFGAVDTGAAADGIYLTLIPRQGEDGQPRWADTYRPCRAGPPCFQGYAVIAGERYELGEGAQLGIDALDAHYLTTRWYTAVSKGEGLRFYNCGGTGSWAY